MGQTVEITDDNFKEQVLESNLPVLIDFWAVWCGPCKMVGPIVEQIAAEKSGQLKVGKVDVDSHKTVAGQYGIRSIPTLLLFKEGQVVEQIVGALSKSQLEEKIEPHL